MKKLIYLLILLTPVIASARPDTVYYFGVNGKVINVDQKIIMKKVDFRRGGKVHVKTFKNTETGWIQLFSEKMKPLNDSVYEIRMKSDEFSGKVIRNFQPMQNGNLQFTDRLNKVIKRTGVASQTIPLIFDGEVTENYNSGNKKSVAVYKNNELVSNKNWLPDGTPLPDNIFYSADSEPRFEPGMGFIYQQIRKAIIDSKFDLQTVEGKMVVGLVITKEGKIGGVQIVKGISQVLNGILIDAFGKVEGAWFPAKLNGQPVNYFQPIPINFIYNKYDFESVEMQGGMLYWVIN